MADYRQPPPSWAATAGFTLVEIVAVLVILGILAAVAIPKYFNLQEEAKKKAMAAAMAEGIGRVNQHFAKQLLQGEAPTQIVYDNATLGTDLGDFTLDTVSNADNTLTLTVAAKAGTQLANEAPVSRTLPKPGYP